MARIAGVAFVLFFVACSTPNAPNHGNPGNDHDLSAGSGESDMAVDVPSGADLSIPTPTGTFAITPVDAVLQVHAGQLPPTLQYTATVDGQTVAPAWTIDRGEIASLDVASGLLTPTGALGGVAHVTATMQGRTAHTTVTVKLSLDENGGSMSGGPGSGGNGGVGGNGAGGPVGSGTQGTLNGTPMTDAALTLLYPYAQTVWPRGLLPPLLQWNSGTHNFDAVSIHIKSKSFEYQGYFAKNATPFNNHPITPAAWKALTYSNAGGSADPVTVTLVFAEGDKAWGPITTTWLIAPGTLQGTIYYSSYGTNLVINSGEKTCAAGNVCSGRNADQTGPEFGAATLAIRPGKPDPVVVAGTASPGNNTGCQVCHSVSANGARLVVQHGPDGYKTSSWYDLATGAETVMAQPGAIGDGRYTYPALFPDGSLLWSHAGNASGIGGDTTSQLYSFTTTPPGATAVPSTGLPSGLNAAMPAFSPDGKHVAFNFYTDSSGNADKRSLALLDFDLGTKAFSNLQTVVYKPTGSVVWPSFLPTGKGVVYELETAQSRSWELGATRSSCDGNGACSTIGARGELWWVDLATKQVTRLDKLNGAGYLPQNPRPTPPNNYDTHANDAALNYEPTVNPVASGGYAWVVFTSRRMYGNVATINEYWSDPRFHDISKTPTTKKLWVAAIDLNAPPGTDPSHPAFYLPGQELLAGNARAFWAVDPCHGDGVGCVSGDECCGGYCRPEADAGLICTSTQPSCAGELEKCTADSDCCGFAQGYHCVNGRCSQPPIP
jgi:hypothetical protein